MVIHERPLSIRGLSNLTRIGVGGLGAVYRGIQDRGGRPVAVKVFSTGPLDSGSLRQFRRDLAHLESLAGFAAFAPILDSGEADDGSPFIVMPFYQRGPLSVHVENTGPLAPELVMAIVRSLASGLRVAHAAGILVRSIGPQNIMIRDDGACTLTDIPLSVCLDIPRTPEAETRDASVTAPEVLAGRIYGRDEYTAAADIYALGATAFFLLTGRPLHVFSGGETELERMLAVLHSPPPQFPSDTPADFAAALTTSVAGDPAERPDAETMARSLHKVAQSLGPAAPRPIAVGDPVHPPPEHNERERSAAAPETPTATGATLERPDPGVPAADQSPAVPPPARSPKSPPQRFARSGLRRPRVVRSAVVIATLFALVTTTYLVGHGEETEPETRSPTPTTSPQITLRKPAINGKSARLSWSGPPGTRYTVVMKAQQQQDFQVGTKTEIEVPIDSSRGYCIAVFGTLGTRTLSSNFQPIGENVTCEWTNT